MIGISLIKHHAGYIRDLIRQTVSAGDMQKELTGIGQSQMDLYTGTLSADQITKETIAYLEKHRALENVQFAAFLGPSGYRTFLLSDGSEWVLRQTYDDPVCFVHLHPGRYAENTIRVKAGTLKTAIAVCWQMKRMGLEEIPDTGSVNRIRAEMAGLPPVADFAEMNATRELIALFRK